MALKSRHPVRSNAEERAYKGKASNKGGKTKSGWQTAEVVALDESTSESKHDHGEECLGTTDGEIDSRIAGRHDALGLL